MKKRQQEYARINGIYNTFLKRLFDVALSGAALLLLWPVIALIALIIKVTDPGPVLFSQKRVGIKKKGEITYFPIYKFRTMKTSTPKDVPTHLLGNPEQWITGIGKILRKTSLDELPQIWNIFVGHMSIVGPRPALWNQYDLIEEREKYMANDVMPGLTGWAQINGRDELPIDVKAKMDGDYVKNLGLLFDLKCFLLTITSVLRSDGVVEGGTGTMEKAEEK